MGLNDSITSERLHIGFFGLCNAGKSSVVNAVTGQELAVVSDRSGTTTDPVKKAMELLPLGPVEIIDTPGLDDEGELGEKRIKKAKQILALTDIAVLVVDSTKGLSPLDNELIKTFEEKALPYVLVMNKCDLLSEVPQSNDTHTIWVSAQTGYNVNALKDMIGALAKSNSAPKYIVSDLLNAGDVVVMVIPIDESAPKGRIILPQQMTLRDLLDKGCTAICCKDTELKSTLECLKEPPAMVITDSQVFGKVARIVPNGVTLTSFSILMARYKGELDTLVKGAKALESLKDGDRVLISEGCTHHRQCNDIGTVKIPGWIKNFTNKDIVFEFTSGGDFPEDLDKYALIVHCGGCMLNEKEMKRRIKAANISSIPMVNYGVAIAHMNGILKRSLEPFEDVLSSLK
ncbi:MAG: [FeFe] hydrogenase H-cluster maturation GTPase HydF [Clostridiales bacterium]|nr:[FeFe] hydrogenase H-cluster maturation GTPase HydF [Clostridiales bacterium]